MNQAAGRTWEKDLNPSVEKGPVAVQTMLLVFQGKGGISDKNFSHVAHWETSEALPESIEAETGLIDEVRKWRHNLELNLLRPPQSPETHYLVVRKIGNGPWAVSQVDRPKDSSSDIEKQFALDRPQAFPTGISNFSDFGVNDGFLNKTWEKAHRKAL